MVHIILMYIIPDYTPICIILCSHTSTERRRQYSDFCNQLMPLENGLHMMQDSERSRGIDHSDDDDEYERRTSDLMSTSYAQPQRRVSSISASFETDACTRRSSSVSSNCIHA